MLYNAFRNVSVFVYISAQNDNGERMPDYEWGVLTTGKIVLDLAEQHRQSHQMNRRQGWESIVAW
jgi:hypothetical protein